MFEPRRRAFSIQHRIPHIRSVIACLHWNKFAHQIWWTPVECSWHHTLWLARSRVTCPLTIRVTARQSQSTPRRNPDRLSTSDYSNAPACTVLSFHEPYFGQNDYTRCICTPPCMGNVMHRTLKSSDESSPYLPMHIKPAKINPSHSAWRAINIHPPASV